MRYHLADPQQQTKLMQELQSLSKRCATIELHEVKRQRSLPQNALFHIWVKALADHLGYSQEDMKIAIKYQLLGYTVHTDPLTGEAVLILPSTAHLTTTQMADLITQLHTFALQEFGFDLPREGEKGFTQMIDRYGK